MDAHFPQRHWLKLSPAHQSADQSQQPMGWICAITQDWEEEEVIPCPFPSSDVRKDGATPIAYLSFEGERKGPGASSICVTAHTGFKDDGLTVD